MLQELPDVRPPLWPRGKTALLNSKYGLPLLDRALSPPDKTRKLNYLDAKLTNADLFHILGAGFKVSDVDWFSIQHSRLHFYLNFIFQ